MRKHFAATLAACLFAIVSLVFVGGMRLSRFQDMEGERTFYLYSKSSQAVIKKVPSILEWGQIRGESIVLFSVMEVETLMERYCATLLFVEEAGGTTSYYCYTPKWSNGIRLGMHFVNLHIAVGEGRQAVGSPIIFGGF